jgi:hypothetical protein
MTDSLAVTRDQKAPRRTAAFAFTYTDPSPVRMPRTGLEFPRHLPYEGWLSIGRQLSALTTSSAWCLGDWLVFGELAYSGRYREAIEQTSLDYKTLRNYAWVTRRFALSRRRDNLSFGHHAEVAALPEREQDYWLRKAEDHSWSRNQLRREVRASLNERSLNEEPDEAQEMDGPDDLDRAGCRIQLRFTPTQFELFASAATRAGVDVETWAIQALDRAARHA